MQGLLDAIAYDGIVEVNIDYFDTLKNNNKIIKELSKLNSPLLSNHENYVEDVLEEDKLNNPKFQPNFFKPYYLNKNGKQIIFPHQNLFLKLITKTFIYVGNLLLKKGLKMREG
jgi:hypothetical protein